MNKELIDSYFINNTYLRKLEEREKREKEPKPYTKKEYKKYKKDVFKIIKDMMNGSKEYEELRDTLDKMIYETIEHIKFKKLTTMVQEELPEAKSKKERKFLKETLLTKVEEGNMHMFKSLNPKTTSVDESLGVIRKKTKKTKPVIPIQKTIEKEVAFLPDLEKVKEIENCLNP